MPHENITMVGGAIHNPAEPRHYMRLKPVAGRVSIRAGDLLLAQSTRATRLIEVARDLYDPVIYVPEEDLVTALTPVPGKSTHCPLKGDASYFSLGDDGAPIAWTYDRPLDFARELQGLVAFYADRVSVEETGARAGGPA